MHPASSVILFTTLSGAGFGLLFWLGLTPAPATGWAAFWPYSLGFALAVGGLLCSTFHLHHPERALRAFTQWRSSWLSREAICVVAALVLMGFHAAGLIFLGSALPLLGWLGAGLCLLTVFTTSMIYAQMKTVPRWNTPLTPVLYLTYALAGGAVLSGWGTGALVLLPLAALGQIAWWVQGDDAFARRGATLGTATGLGDLGQVRSFAHPHTAPNYLMREFIHILARRHALRLRGISLLLMLVLPLAVLTLLPAGLWPLATALHLAGVATSRWLFFAEAEHTVGLYYGLR